MQLSELIADNRDCAAVIGGVSCDIRGLACDSRKVGDGFLFAALPGERHDGRDFIDQAVERGARAALGPVGLSARAPGHVTVVESHNPRRALAQMAARWWHPQPAVVAAVTGTNGKSSVVTYLRQLWGNAGIAAAGIGTLGIETTTAKSVKQGKGRAMTTPDSLALHEMLHSLSGQSIGHVAIETSSHALAQHRVDGVVLSAAAFTCLGRDHLDYHHDQESYFHAKGRLFSDILPISATAVLNRDSPHVFDRLYPLCRRRKHRIFSYGWHDDSDSRRGNGADIDISCRRQGFDRSGISVVLDIDGHAYPCRLPFIADFQVMNALCALGMFAACGGRWSDGVAGLAGLTSPTGRLQAISSPLVGDRSIYIDYAHTADALSCVLTALRQHMDMGFGQDAGKAGPRLHLVFGCGGNRDVEKRPEMGCVAAHLADCITVTDDNPRDEDPAAIRRAILAGMSDIRAGHRRPARVEEIAGRRRAIIAAVAAMGPHDTLLIAGMGHEQFQIVAGRRRPLDERAAVISGLAKTAKKRA